MTSSPIPHTTPADWPVVGAGRFAAGIRRESPDGCRLALVGLPDDLGVRLNHGRVGAASGPRAFRGALARFGADFDGAAGRSLPGSVVFDAGDVTPAPGVDAEALHRTHERITEALAAVHGLGLIPVCIGGGHDLTFPTVRALAQRVGRPVGGINVDAHLDVRETVGSGMPFRALIEGKFLDPQRFVTVGAGRFSDAREHVEYLLTRKATITDIDSALGHSFGAKDAIARAFAPMSNGKPGPAGFVSIDLDAIDGSQAPGVSAVNPQGLSVAFVCDIARRAGAHAAVRHFDIMELNPAQDDPALDPLVPEPIGRTARVAALVFLSFITGFAERGS